MLKTDMGNKMTSWLNYNRDDGAAPRKAAAIILFEQATGAALLVRRNDALAFMGGHHAFPGGGISQRDTGCRVQGATNVEQARTITAAVRELFEETGILLAKGAPMSSEEKAVLRQNVLRHPDIFEDRLEAEGLLISAQQFAPAGRWITPTFAPMRFDTQYFLYRCNSLLPASPIGHEGEITETVWLKPCEALDMRARGAILMSTPVVFALRRLAALPLETALDRLQHTPGFSEIIHDYIEPAHGVHIVPIKSRTLPPGRHTNCALIGETELAIIDPGIDDAAAWTRFSSHLDEILAMAGGTLRAILLTHDHPDHSASVHRLARKYNAPVYAHAACYDKDIAITDKDCIELAGAPPWRIRCLHTPGHHPGHFAFYEETTDTLLCGDMIANPGTVMIDPENGGDMYAYMRSLERLSTLRPKLTIPAHGAPLPDETGSALIRKTIGHRNMRETRIKEALARGANTIEAILEIAYDDTPKGLYPLARRQLRAHLNAMNVIV